jgi:hemerythrin-like metal-binding protein
MTTGLESLDAQHKQLISWLNDLLHEISLGRSRAEVEAMMDRLDGYVVNHFSQEEACMTRYKCPVAAANLAAHANFVAMFALFKEEFERDGVTAHLVVRLESELTRWLSGHIKRTDTQLAPCVRDRVA